LTHESDNHTTNRCNDEHVERPGENVGKGNDALPPLSVPSTEEEKIVASSTKSPSTTLREEDVPRVRDISISSGLKSLASLSVREGDEQLANVVAIL
jgi:hypothetical protein